MIGYHIQCTLKTPLEPVKPRRRVATRVSRPHASCFSSAMSFSSPTHLPHFRLAFPLKILRTLLSGGYIGTNLLHSTLPLAITCVYRMQRRHRPPIRLLNWRVALGAHLSTLDDLFTPASRSSMVGRPRQRSGQLNLVPSRPCRYQDTDDEITQATGIARRLATA